MKKIFCCLTLIIAQTVSAANPPETQPQETSTKRAEAWLADIGSNIVQGIIQSAVIKKTGEWLSPLYETAQAKIVLAKNNLAAVHMGTKIALKYAALKTAIIANPIPTAFILFNVLLVSAALYKKCKKQNAPLSDQL